MSVSVDFTPGNDKVVVNSLGPRRLSITGSGVTVTDDPTHGLIDIVVGGGGSVTGGTNLGSGTGVFKDLSGTNLEFKSLIAGTGVNITNTATGITINSTATGTGGGTITGLSNIGTLGFGIGVGASGANLQFQNIVAASNKIALAQDNINNNLSIDVAQDNLSLGSIGGTASWSQVSKTGSNLSDIANVVLASPTNGQSLVYSSGNWINSTISGGGGGGGGSVVGVGGSFTQSGDSSTTVFNIPHGLGATPLIYTASADSRDAASDFFTTANSTNIVITYLFAPPTGTGNLIWNWFALPASSIYPETKGLSLPQSGDATTTAFTITHGLGSTPNFVSIEPASADAASDYYVTVSSTVITITYTAPPPHGTNNLAWWWRTTG